MDTTTMTPSSTSAPTLPTPQTAVTGVSGAAFEVEPAVLIGAAGTFDAESDAIVHAATRLRLRLDAIGPCWGSDPVGERFGAAYRPVSTAVLGNVAALSNGLIRIAAALRAVATSYELADGPSLTTAPTTAPTTAIRSRPMGGPVPAQLDPLAPVVATAAGTTPAIRLRPELAEQVLR